MADNYYIRITYDQADDVFNEVGSNLILRYGFNKWGWDIFKEDELTHRLEDDTMYVCIDYLSDVEIDGMTYDSEIALQDCDIADLEPYIEDATDKEVTNYFSTYDLKDSLDIDDIVYDMLADGYDMNTIITELKDTQLPITEIF